MTPQQRLDAAKERALAAGETMSIAWEAMEGPVADLSATKSARAIAARTKALEAFAELRRAKAAINTKEST